MTSDLPRFSSDEDKLQSPQNGSGNDGGRHREIEPHPAVTTIRGCTSTYRGEFTSQKLLHQYSWMYPSDLYGRSRRLKSGYGEINWTDGCKYKGQFKNDVREGPGTFLWKSGEVFDGQYHEDQRHGAGTYKWSTGATFAGTFMHNDREGPGQYISAGGEKFKGVYRQGVRNGEGTFWYVDGTKDSGVWRGNKLVQLEFPAYGIRFFPYSVYRPDVHRIRRKHKPKPGLLENLSEEFLMSAATNKLKKVEEFVDAEVVYADVRDSNLCSPFFAAAINSNCEVVEFLLDYTIHVDINQIEKHGVTALNACCHLLYSAHPEVVRVLFDPLSKDDTDVFPKLDRCKSSLLNNPLLHSTLEELKEKEDEADGCTSVSMTQLNKNNSNSSSLDPFAKSKLSALQRSNTAPQLVPLKKKVCSSAKLRKGAAVGLSELPSIEEAELLKSEEPETELVKDKQNTSLLNNEAPMPLSKLSKNETPKREVPNKDFAKEGLPDDVASDDMPREDLTEKALPKDNFLKDDVAKENLPKDNLPKDDAAKYNLTKNDEGTNEMPQDVVAKEDLPKDDVAKCKLPIGDVAKDNLPKDDANKDKDGMLEDELSSVGPALVGGVGKEVLDSSKDAIKHLPKKGWSVEAESSDAVASSQLTGNDAKKDSGKISSIDSSLQSLDSSMESESSCSSLVPGSVSVESSILSVSEGLQSGSELNKESSVIKIRHPLPSLKNRPRMAMSLDNYELMPSLAKYRALKSASPPSPVPQPVTAVSSRSSSRTSSSSSMKCSSASPKASVVPPTYTPDLSLKKVIYLLLDKGANPNISVEPVPPLLYSMLAGDPEMSDRLLRRGADPHYQLPPKFGGYPLLHLVSKRVNSLTPALVELLLRYGVDPNLEHDIKKPEKESDKAKEAADKAGDKKTGAENLVDTPGCLPRYYLQSMESAQKLMAAAECSDEKKSTIGSEDKATSSGTMSNQPSKSVKVNGSQKAGCTEKPLSQKSDAGAVASKRETQRKPKSMAQARRLKSCSGMRITKASQPVPLASSSNHMLSEGSSGTRSVPKPLARYNSLKLLDPKPKESGPTLKPIKRSNTKSAKVRKPAKKPAVTGGEDSGMDTGKDDMDASVRAAVAKEIASWEEEKIMAGDNEGSTSLTAIHFLCSSKLYGTAQEKKKQYEIIPVTMHILLERGASVNNVFMGHSPLSMAILSGYDCAVNLLIQYGAKPNLPLGLGVGNAMCVATTHMAHKVRLPPPTGKTPNIDYMSPIKIMDLLLRSGGSLLAPVKFTKDTIGIVMDFAHATYKTDRRMSIVKYSNFSKTERLQYQSVKKLHGFLLNLLRCRALIGIGRREKIWKQFRELEEHIEYLNDIELKLRLLNLPANSQERKDAMKRSQNYPELMVLPEISLKVSLDSLEQTLSGDQMENEGREKEAHVEAKKPHKRNSLINKVARYRELIVRAEDFFRINRYMIDRKDWEFSSFCFECGKTAGVHLTLCTGCELISYCGRTCKMNHWKKGHREECCKLEMIKQRILMTH